MKPGGDQCYRSASHTLNLFNKLNSSSGKLVEASSYDLLHADEKALLHQLAVFRGGAALSAVVATAARAS